MLIIFGQTRDSLLLGASIVFIALLSQTAPSKAVDESVPAQAIRLTKEAIEHGTAGNGEALKHVAARGLKLAEMAEEEEPDPHFTLAIKCLKKAIKYADKSNVAEGTQQAAEALTHLEAGARDEIPNDLELATIVVGRDGVPEIERKLGPSPCLVPSVSNESVSYLYHAHGVDGPSYLRVEIAGHVEAITLSKDPPLVGVCYAPLHHTVPLQTGRGVHLGSTPEEVMHIYGRPNEMFSFGLISRFRYEVMLEHPFEWDLVFRDGHLVEWTVATED